MHSSVKFINHDQSEFFPTLKKRVNKYFKDNGITRFGNREMYVKAATLLGLYLGSYLAILFLPISPWFLLLFAVLMGAAKAGIGMSVMHDALHGSCSKHRWVNTALGNTMYLLGGNAFVWKIQHNIFHHTYTNIHGLDEDIKTKLVIRLSKYAPLQWIHRYQHVYVFFLYGFNTLFFIISDLIKLLNYHRTGMIKRQKSALHWELLRLFFTKVAYVFLTVALPMLITPLLWWQVMIGVLAMHFTAGYILTIVFQMAHIVEGVEQPVLNESGDVENAWAVHQLQTTANFSRDNRFLNWFVGGLNFQIEHHLFPSMCHVHYRKISSIVEQTANEFNVPYHVKPTLGSALQSHIKMLKILGETPIAPVLSKEKAVA